jgi:hypothetical protein
VPGDSVTPAYGEAILLMLGALLVFLGFFLFALWRGGYILAKRDAKGEPGVLNLRVIPGYEATREGLAIAAETGRAIHTSPGTGVIGAGDTGTAATLAGLYVTESMARVGAITGAPVEATTNDAIAYALTDNSVRRGYARAGWPIESERESGEARFLTHNDPIAYVAAASEVAARREVSEAVMAGRFGPEVLLLLEAQRRTGAYQIAGSSDPQGIALMHLTADHTLVGEEIFASGAYLERRPSHIASLLAQDGLRWTLIAFIVVLFVLANIFGVPWSNWFTFYP